jgi:hypothetical protein
MEAGHFAFTEAAIRAAVVGTDIVADDFSHSKMGKRADEQR